MKKLILTGKGGNPTKELDLEKEAILCLKVLRLYLGLGLKEAKELYELFKRSGGSITTDDVTYNFFKNRVLGTPFPDPLS